MSYHTQTSGMSFAFLISKSAISSNFIRIGRCVSSVGAKNIYLKNSSSFAEEMVKLFARVIGAF